MDKRIIQAAVGVALATALGALAGAGHDRAAIDLRDHDQEVIAKRQATDHPAAHIRR